MQYFKYFIISFLFISCETLVDDLPLSRFPELKSKLVLTSFISPQDSLIKVRLSQSIPLFGEFPANKLMKVIDNKGDTILIANYDTENIVEDAQMILSNGVQSVTIPFDIRTREYIIPMTRFPIMAGETYTLTAKTKDLFVEATTTVPFEQINVRNVKIDSVYEQSNIWEPDSLGHFKPSTKKVKVYYVEFDWKDKPEIANYYKIDALIYFEVEFPNLINGKIVYKNIRQAAYTNWSANEYAPLKRYLNDIKYDGKQIYSPRGRIESLNIAGSGTTLNGQFYPAKLLNKNPTLTIKLNNVNKDFYENQVSIEKTEPFGDGNPFVEPVQIYSNVKNGLGCFGAYNQSKYTTQIK